MNIEIYQVKREKLRDFGFLSFEGAERFNGVGSVQPENYDRVYKCDIQSSYEMTLDDLFDIFNQNRPDDFTGHSMSVSDVVGTDDGYWYCDDIGWKKLDWERGVKECAI